MQGRGRPFRKGDDGVSKSGELWGALRRETLLQGVERMTDQKRVALVRKLSQTIPHDRILADRDQLISYSYDATGERHLPDVVVLPVSKEEVVEVMKIAKDHGIVIIGRGAGTNLSGGTTPVVGGLVISLAKMNRILHIDPENRQMVVEPGVVNAQAQEALKSYGFFYPPDPSSHRISTLGGNVSENSGGPHCVKYGVTTNHVLELELVTADGELIEMPVTRDHRVELDLSGLITGSEGTLGVLTQLTLSISPLPSKTQTMLAVFNCLDDAFQCVSAIIAAKIIPATLELLDRVSIEIVEEFTSAVYPKGAEAVLLIEVDGEEETLTDQSRTIEEVARARRAQDFLVARTEAEAEALWKGRRSQYGAAARVAPHLWVQDVTVPRPLLSTMMRAVIEIGQEYGFPILTVAHAGDGNLHPVIPYNPSDPEEVGRMRAADQAILKKCVELGGSITGEHGIGIDKVENLALMYGEPERQIMMALKDSFDPERRLNPFKAVMPPKMPLESGAGGMTDSSQRTKTASVSYPSLVEEVQDEVMRARRDGVSLRVQGSGLRYSLGRADDRDRHRILATRQLNRIIDFDPENLSIEVEAGITGGELLSTMRTEGLDLAGLELHQEETIGGLVASNARYWRDSYGLGWRDVILAVEWVDARGQALRFGRKTMKNVAGYDVPKLAVGSWGRLGILTKLTLRLKPYVPLHGLGVGRHPDASWLLRKLADWSAHPIRPHGCVVRSRIGAPAEAWVYGEGPDIFRIQEYAHRELKEADWQWEFEKGGALMESLERERTDSRHRALRERCYAEGGVRPGELGTILTGVPGGMSGWFFPGCGSYELLTFHGEDIPGLSRAHVPSGLLLVEDPARLRFNVAITRVFDPVGLFA